MLFVDFVLVVCHQQPTLLLVMYHPLRPRKPAPVFSIYYIDRHLFFSELVGEGGRERPPFP